MATYNKLTLSASTDGRPILVAQTATAGTTIHTASSNTSIYHEVWIYAQNTDTTNRKLTVEFGGVTAPNDLIELTVPAEAGLTLVVPGIPLRGNATPLVVRAFAATANVVTISGYVNEIVN